MKNKPFTVTFEIEGESMAQVLNRALVMLYKSDTDANSVSVESDTGERAQVGMPHSPRAILGDDARELLREAKWLKKDIPHGEVGHD